MVRMLLIKGRRVSAALHLTPPPYTEGGCLVRRTILLGATMALTLLVASGVALALTKIGGPGPDTLRGDQRGRQPPRQGRQRHTLRPAGPRHPPWRSGQGCCRGRQ